MVKSTFDQLHQVFGSNTYTDDLNTKWAEICGSQYGANTFTTTSGSINVTAGSPLSGSDVGNFITVSDNAYQLTAVSGTTLTLNTPAQTTEAGTAGEQRWNKNLQSDLNYLRSQVQNMMGSTNWNDDVCTTLCDMSNLIPKGPNPVGDNTHYPDIRSGIATFDLSNQHVGFVSSGSPVAEYTDSASTVTAGTNLTFTDDTTLQISIPGGFSKADQGALFLIKDNGMEGFLDLATAWTNDGCVLEVDESDVGSNPDYVASNITTDIINLTGRRCMNDSVDGYGVFWPAHQIASMNATLTLPVGYKGTLKIDHQVPGIGIEGTQTNTLAEFWVDTTTKVITAAAPTVAINSGINKFLSGVPYYDTNTTFNLSVGNTDHIFDRGYVVNPCSISLSEFNASDQTPSFASLGLSVPTAITDTIGTYSQTPGITVGGGNFRNMDARCTVTFRDVWGSQPSADSAAGTFRIDTFGVTSTDTQRLFDDEAYRFVGTENLNNTGLVSGDTNWNSATSVLTQTDPSGDMALVVYNGTLKYPSIDHSTFLPVGPDYTGQAGTAVDYELFIASAAFTNGYITFSGWANALSTVQSANVQIDLRYPNCTDYGNSNTNVWQSLKVDQTTFAGNGCLGAGSSGSNVAFSFGTTSSVSYGNRIIMRVRFTAGSVTPLTGITFNPTL